MRSRFTVQYEYIGGALPEGFPRYAYAGQHGYESGLLSRSGANPNLPPITLQHLGWRWYDPAIGRFVQRDPIGIAGGMNVYAYVDARPLQSVDSDGLIPEDVPPWMPGDSPFGGSRALGSTSPGGGVVGTIFCARGEKVHKRLGAKRNKNVFIDKLRKVSPGRYTTARWFLKWIVPPLTFVCDLTGIQGDNRMLRAEDLVDPNDLE